MCHTPQEPINNFDRYNLFCWTEESIEGIRRILMADHTDSALKVNNAKYMCDRELKAIAALKEKYKNASDLNQTNVPV